MQIKNLLLLVCLWATTILGANPNPAPLHFATDAGTAMTTCNIPAPTNFQAVDIGPTWVTLTWNPWSLLESHRIRTYRASDNFLLNTTTTPAGATQATITGLPSGTECYSVINAICQDGSHSPDVAQTSKFTTIIIEVLVELFPTPTTPNDCTIAASGDSCDYPGTGAIFPFRITYGSDDRIFGMRRTFQNNQPVDQCVLPNSNTNQALTLLCGDTNPTCTTTAVVVKYGQAQVGSFNIHGMGTSMYLEIVSSSAGFTIQDMVPARMQGLRRPGGPGLIQSRGDNSTGESGQLSAGSGQLIGAAPNPFTDELNVLVATSDAAQINLQLYDLNGQKVLERQFEGGQEQYSLPTASLPPGFYMLHWQDPEGRIQMLKVVKSN